MHTEGSQGNSSTSSNHQPGRGQTLKVDRRRGSSTAPIFLGERSARAPQTTIPAPHTREKGNRTLEQPAVASTIRPKGRKTIRRP